MKKAVNCCLLQYLLPLLTTLSGTCIILFAFYAFWHRGVITRTSACVAAIVSMLMFIALSFFISAKLYRWYNTEQAIKIARGDNITFVDALMVDNRQRYLSILCMAGGFFSITVGIINLTNPSIARKISIFYAILFAVSILATLAVAGISLYLYWQRRSSGEMMIGIMYYHRVVAGNTGIKVCLMLPDSKASSYYDYASKPIITTTRPSMK